jgi:hypothetical protein
MEKSNLKIYLLIALVFLAIIATGIYLVVTSSNNSAKPYPNNVKDVISNPVKKVGDWSILEETDKYVINYSKVGEVDEFYITIYSNPAYQTSIEAENRLLNKLKIDKDYACSLPITIQVQRAVDESLWGYNFGLSFCKDKLHISDILQQPSTTGEQLKIPEGDTFYIQTTDNNRIQTKNFYKTAQKIFSNSVLIKQEPHYSVYYYPNSDSFIIETGYTTEDDFKSVASSASASMQSALGISKEQLCKLPVTVKTTSNKGGSSEPISLFWLLNCKN